MSYKCHCCEENLINIKPIKYPSIIRKVQYDYYDVAEKDRLVKQTTGWETVSEVFVHSTCADKKGGITNCVSQKILPEIKIITVNVKSPIEEAQEIPEYMLSE